MTETLPPPVIDPAQAVEQQAQQAAVQAVEQQAEPAFKVVDKRSSAPEPYFAEAAANPTEVDAAQGAANARVQELVDKESFKLGSRAVERGKLGDMLYQDAIAQTAREGHDVTHLFETKSEGKHADDSSASAKDKAPVDAERIGKHSADNPDVLSISLDSIKAKLAQEAADEVKPFNADGTPATMTLKDGEQLDDAQKSELRAAAQKIGDQLTADEKAAETAINPTRKNSVAKHIRSLFRSKKIIEGLVAEQAETAPESTEPSLDLMDDLATHDTDDAEITPDEVISDEEKAKLNTEDKERAAQQTTSNLPVEAFNPDGTPARLTLAESQRLTDEQKAQLQVFAVKQQGKLTAKPVKRVRAAVTGLSAKAKDRSADQRLKMRVDYLRLGAPHG